MCSERRDCAVRSGQPPGCCSADAKSARAIPPLSQTGPDDMVPQLAVSLEENSMSVHADRLVVTGASSDRFDEILTPEALAFVAELHGLFDGKRRALLEFRDERQEFFDDGGLPDFLPETQSIRDGDWKVAPIPADLLDRRVEITGPVDRKMIINALNSGAKVFMADFEDALFADLVEHDRGPDQPARTAGPARSTSPTRGPARHTRSAEAGRADGAAARLAPARGATSPSTASRSSGRAVRFRALFLPQRQGARSPRAPGPISTCRRSRAISRRGSGTRSSSSPQERLGLPLGTIKATVLIETLPAAFEMDEILYELRDHMAGLNCGRWDYIFSFIKTLAQQQGVPPARPRPGRHGQGVPARLFGSC